MWKTLTVVSILISVVSCVLAVQAVRNQERAVRQAVKQYEAEVVQRYAPMIRKMLAERGRDNIIVVNPSTVDELVRSAGSNRPSRARGRASRRGNPGPHRR